jgi:hypothetical protein
VNVLCVSLGDAQPAQDSWLTLHRDYLLLAILALPGRSVKFRFRQGDDLLITQPGGEFVTMFPGGSTNAWFKNAEVFPH